MWWVIGNWVRTEYSFELGIGYSWRIGTPCLCLPVCKILNQSEVFVWGTGVNPNKQLQAYCECGWVFLSCLAGDAWTTCFQPPMPGEISVSLQWGSGPLYSETPLMPSWWWVWGYVPPPGCSGRGWRQLFWVRDDFQLWTSQIPCLGWFGFFFKRAYKSMSTANHGEKHSLSLILLLRDKAYLLFYLLLWLVKPEEDSKCLICLS